MIETERRFLIKKPTVEYLGTLVGDNIEQIYIDSEDGATARVRARTHGGSTVYTHTVKHRRSDISSVEDERVITREEFLRLADGREEGTRTITKTRYVLPYRGLTFEIDVYPEWKTSAIMEVELESEDENVTLPPSVEIIREVSGDRSLSNHALSRHFPTEAELLSEE